MRPSRANLQVKASGIDWLHQANAERLAGKIAAYWYDRGYAVTVYLVKHGEMHCVRSSLINGHPQTKRFASAEVPFQ